MKIFCVGKPPQCISGQWISTIIVSLCFFSSGLSTGWTSPAFMKVEKKEVSFSLTAVEMGFIAAIPFFSRLLSPIPSSYAMDGLGRRGCLTMGRVIQLVHWVLMYSSHNVWVMYAARFLSGWWSGMGVFIAAVYVGETTSKRIRGRSQASLNVCFLLGVSFITSVGSSVSYDNLLIIAGVVDFMTFVLMFLVPETPYFFLKRDEYDQAENSLKWLRGREDVTRELNRIDRYLKIQMKESNTYSYIFKRKSSRKAFVIVQILFIIQRLSGMVPIVSYASFITPDTWWLPNDKGPILLNLTYLIMCIFTGTFVDKWGRRTLLIFSTSGSAVFMCACTFWFFLDHTDYYDVTGTEWIPIAFLIGQGAFYSSGLCYIPALIMSEMFAMNIKAKANALGAMTATFFTMVVVFIFLPLSNAVGMYINFLIYTLAVLVGSVYSTTIPETRGKTLETIQAHLEGRIASDSSISQVRSEHEVTEEPE